MKYTILLTFTKHQVEFLYKGSLHYIPLSEFKELKGNLQVLKDLLDLKYVYTQTH